MNKHVWRRHEYSPWPHSLFPLLHSPLFPFHFEAQFETFSSTTVFNLLHPVPHLPLHRPQCHRCNRQLLCCAKLVLSNPFYYLDAQASTPAEAGHTTQVSDSCIFFSMQATHIAHTSCCQSTWFKLFALVDQVDWQPMLPEISWTRTNQFIPCE